MAGINLAGAVGMTGKRESIFSDLAPIVQHTGDAIAKSIQESKARREKDAVLKLQQQQEDNAKNTDEWSKFVLSKSDLSSEFSSPYFKESTEIGKQVMAINADPNISQAKKQEIIESKKLDLAGLYNKYKADEEAVKYYQTSLNDDTLDVSKASNFLAGTENVVTKDKEVLINEQTAPYKVNVPMEEAQTQTISETTGIEPQYFSLSAAERMKKTPMGLGTTFREKIGLVNTTPEETINSILPKETLDDIVEGVTTNGNTKFDVNKDKLKSAEDLYAYNVTEGASTKAKILKRGYEALALKQLKETNQNLTDAEIAELIPQMVEARTREDFRNIINPKIGGLINDKTNRFSTKQSSGSTQINPENIVQDVVQEEYANTGNHLGYIKDQKVIVENKQYELNKYKELQANNPDKNYDKAIKQAEENLKNVTIALKNAETKDKIKVSAKGIVPSLTNASIPFDGLTGDGWVFTQNVIDDKGNVFAENKRVVKEKDRLTKKDVETNEIRLVPLTPSNRNIMLQRAGDNKMKAVAELKFIEDKASEIKKKNVPSQGKKEEKKTPKMTQAEFNSQWAKLKKGESLLAPNGVMYKKQ